MNQALGGKHTATPWQVSDEIFVIGADGSNIFGGASTKHSDEQCMADAEFIVTACNSYDAMRAALEACQKAICMYHCQLGTGKKDAPKGHVKVCNQARVALNPKEPTHASPKI